MTADPASEREHWGRTGGRGQVVLLAAGVVAVALGAMLLSYLQVAAVSTPEPAGGVESEVTAGDVRRALDRAVANASRSVPADARDDPNAVRTRFTDTLADDVSTLRAGWERGGAVVTVAANASAADAWADNRCPDGPRRQFDDCTASDGLVTQERLDEAYVVAVALDVRIETDRRTTRATFVVPVA